MNKVILVKAYLSPNDTEDFIKKYGTDYLESVILEDRRKKSLEILLDSELNSDYNKIHMEYLGLSRIDGAPIFRLNLYELPASHSIKDVFQNYSFKKFKIKDSVEISLIKEIDDHIPS